MLKTEDNVGTNKISGLFHCFWEKEWWFACTGFPLESVIDIAKKQQSNTLKNVTKHSHFAKDDKN